MLERCFGDGQFKRSAVVSAFQSSKQLTRQIQLARENFLDRHELNDTRFYKEVESLAEPKELIQKLVAKRGHLFHNTRKGANNWSPEKQEDFRAEAKFLHTLCLNIALEIISPAHTTEANQKYRDQADAIGARIMLIAEFNFVDEDGIEKTESVYIKMTGTKPTNFAIRESINIAIDHFDENINSSRLEQLNIKMEDGRTLASLRINAEN